MNKIEATYDDATNSFGPVTVDGKVLDPKPSQKLRNHSPLGFAWGYGGSGPAQLALAILLDVVGKDRALANYQAFKWEFLAAGQTFGQNLDLYVDVKAWVAEHEAKRAKATEEHVGTEE